MNPSALDSLIVVGIAAATTHQQYADLANLWHTRANVSTVQQQYPLALKYIQQAQEIRRQHGLYQDLPKGEMVLSTAYMALNELESALKHAQAARAAFLLQGDYESAASAILNVARIQNRTLDVVGAIASHREALALFRAHPDISPRVQAQCFQGMAVNYLNTEPDSVLLYAGMARSVFEKFTFSNDLPQNYQITSRAHLALRHYEEAQFWGQKAVEIVEAFPQRFKIGERADSYSQMGLVYREMGKKDPRLLEKSLKYLYQADKLAGQQEDLAPMVNSQYQLSRVLALMGRHKEAFLAADSAYMLKNILYDQQAQANVQRLNTVFQTKEKEAAAAAALHRKQMQLAWTIAGLFLLLGGVAVFVLLNRRLRRQRATIAAQNAELAILNKSISHNAKNDLNRLQSLARRAVSSASPDDLEDVLRYIQTVTAVRRLTDAKGGTPAQLNPTYLIPALLRIHPRPVRTHLDLDEVPLLPEQQGLALAQLLNEWLTNAHKHAFKQHPNPELHLSCRVSGGQYEVMFADNGPGLPTDAAPTGGNQRGLGLIQDYVHLLGGVLTTDSSPAGLRYTLRFPVGG